MPSAKQEAANRENAQRSTGPKSADGKATSSRNAVRHGVFARVATLPAEEQAEFDKLIAHLEEDLRPVGALEIILVEKIALAIWRNRRLLLAETASIALNQTPDRLAIDSAHAADPGISKPLLADDLTPPDPEVCAHFQNILAEADLARGSTLSQLSAIAPAIQSALEDETRTEKFETVQAYLESDYGGQLNVVVDELVAWARSELAHAAHISKLNELLASIRQRNGLPPPQELERYARYQSILDGQLFKTLKALSEAQAARRAAIEMEATAIDLVSER